MWCQKCKRDLPDRSFEGKKIWCNRCRRRQGRRAKKYAPRIKVKYSGLDYHSRNRILKRLGFKAYEDYLVSDLWRSIKVRVYEAKGEACSLCGVPATELHHNRYHRNDLSGRNLAHIHPLCRSCHRGIEFNAGAKTSLLEAAANYEARLAGKRPSGAVPDDDQIPY